MKKLLLFLPMFFLLGGCYPYTEVENMDILTSVYVDKTDEDIRLGGGVANVRSFSDSMAEDPVSLISAEGETLENAIQNLYQSADHELFFGALRAVVVGEGLAKDGTERFLRYLDAQPRLRRSTAVFVTDGDLEEILEYKAINDFSAGFAADSIITTLYEEKQMRYTSIGDVMYAFSCGDAGYSVPHITVENDVMRVDGYALFTGGKMVGYTNNPSLLFFTVNGAVQRHLLGATPLITRLMTRSVTPEVQNGKLHIAARFVFAAETDSGAPVSAAQCKALEKKLQAQVEAALAYSKKIGCDYLELYKSRMAQSRADFDMEQWNALLPEMTYTVQVSVRAR
ncbi:MAG: hypothetical protein IJD83_01385 [Clostridia bacterium]|nr:hypothetical protein [Clostridia bacterium]